jgi:nitrite reductase/ring-hydroxylating ferredoxin subunit
MEDTDNRVQELIKELSNRNEDVRWGAACALSKIGTPSVEPLMKALTDSDSVVRLRAAWALGLIGDRRATGRLIRALSDGDWAVRMRAAEALGRLGEREALDPLLLALRDEKADVRRHAIGALNRIADPSSADRLGDALNDTDWRVRMGAALALSAIGDEKSLLHLWRATCDENEYVRKIAQAFMGKKEEECAMEITIGPGEEPADNSMNVVHVDEKELLVTKLNGKFFAIGNICTHMGCKLSRGTLDGETVRCPCHGSVFNVKTGEVIKGPAKKPESRYDAVAKGA